jgi:exopolysaccharide biosynthesis protein
MSPSTTQAQSLQRMAASLAVTFLLLFSQLVTAQTDAKVRPSAVDPDNKPFPIAKSSPKQEPTAFVWKQMEVNLPKSIQVFEGAATNIDGQPVRAWYAKLIQNHAGVGIKAIQSTSQNKRDLTSTLAQNARALVAVNSAYFAIKESPSRSASIVVSGGQLIGSPRPTVQRAGKAVPVVYGAFGVTKEGKYDFAWVAELDGKPYAYPTPLPNSETIDSPPPSRTFPVGGRIWNVEEASGGGPMLVRNGAYCVTDTEEKFGASHSAQRNPRTAIGATAKGELILLVVDGRQPEYSMGMSMPELSLAMMELGCVNALNLDGGGSTAFTVRGKLINKPSDGVERPVTDILALVPTGNVAGK